MNHILNFSLIFLILKHMYRASSFIPWKIPRKLKIIGQSGEGYDKKIFSQFIGGQMDYKFSSQWKHLKYFGHNKRHGFVNEGY
jgi:hypothetical protein